MIQIIKKAYIMLASSIQNTRWYHEASKIRKEITSASLPQLPAGKKIILIPHPDDEWVGCSRVVMNSDDDVILCYMDMHGGDDAVIHDKRTQELQQIADANHRTLVIAQGDKTAFLQELIQQNKPQMILLPFFMDWHAEHVQVMTFLYAAVMKLLNDAQTPTFNVAMYQVSVPIPEDSITHAFPLSRKVWNGKWKKFEKVYLTQMGIPYKRFACCERINGKLCNSYAAESFVTQSWKQWVDNYGRMLLDEEKRDVIIENLQSITHTRILLRDYQRKES